MAKILQNIVFLLLAIQFAPNAIKICKKIYSEASEQKTEVGIINIKGEINSNMGTRTIENLRKMFESSNIKAIVLKIDSPGGAPGTSQAIFNEIGELKKNVSPKYVLALIENIGASGAYYIACAADHIITTPSALVGSIGSYMSILSLKKIADKYDINCEVIKSGEYKATGHILTELTDKQKVELQTLSDNIYQQFIKDVLGKRSKYGISTNSDEWAQGRIFSGEQALKLKLIDELGSISNAIEMLRKNAAIIGKISWIKPEEPFNLMKYLSGEDNENESVSKMLNLIQGPSIYLK